jgi:hypothetical protein
MRQLTRCVVAVTVIVLAGCTADSPIQPRLPTPNALISDGAHSNGNKDFFFLPPLVSNPAGSQFFDAGKFNAALAPFVEVCALAQSPLENPAVECRDADQNGRPDLVFGPAPLSLDASNQQYHVNWDTKGSGLDAALFYRITVRGSAQGTALGFLDVDPVLGGVKNAKTGDVFVFQDGRTLPIKVRIEQGAFGSSQSNDRVEQAVPSVIPGGFVDVTTNTGFAGARFSNGWLPEGIDQVVVIIERVAVNNESRGTSCLDISLEQLEGCYRFRTDPDLHGLGPRGTDLLFAVPVIAGVCFEIPGAAHSEDGPPFALHRREEVNNQLVGPAFSLEDVDAPFLRCDGFAKTPSSIGAALRSGRPGDVARASWALVSRGIAAILQPRSLHAVDLGAGGSTNEFSRFGWARDATMTKTAGDGGSAPSGSTIDASVRLENHHHGTDPISAQDVVFTVTGGGGALIDGETAVNTLTVRTNSDGNATVSWRLGPGVNTLEAATSHVAESPVVFTATGTANVGTISGTVLDAAGAPVNDQLLNIIRCTEASTLGANGVCVRHPSFFGAGVATNGSGLYESSGLEPGVYDVRVILGEGSNLVSTPGNRVVAVGAGQTVPASFVLSVPPPIN